MAGEDGGATGPIDTAEVYNVATGTWALTGTMSSARARHTSATVAIFQALCRKDVPLNSIGSLTIAAVDLLYSFQIRFP